MIYAVDASNRLLWYRHTGAGDGTDHWETTPMPEGNVGVGWAFRQVFSDGQGAVYGIDGQNQLVWYRHVGAVDGTNRWLYTPEASGHIGTGWDMKHVFSGGNGVIYAVNQKNQLLWYRHLGYQDGTARWQTTREAKGNIGTGWDMKHVFSGGDGVIYAVNQKNQLLWYRHLGFEDGSDRWQTTPDPRGYIGTGWDMKFVFSGGNGVIYAVDQKDRLLWYRHLGAADGTARWTTTPEKKGYIGVGWGLPQVFGGGFAPRNIGLSMQFQMTTQWCWIAVATSIDRYYNPASTATQPGVMTTIGQKINGFPTNTSAFPSAATVAATPGLADAMNHPTLPPALLCLDVPKLLIDARYDKSGGVGDSLNVAGHWANRSYLTTITLAQLSAELAAGRPVVYGIQFPGVSHYVAVAGVLNDLLLVCDPGNGESTIPFASFPTAYRGGATTNAIALTAARA